MFLFIISVLRKDYENWLRLAVLINTAGKNVCHKILYEGKKITDGKKLYSILQKYRSRISFQMYEEILYPSNEVTDESKFDLLTYTMIIRLMFGSEYKDYLRDMRDMRNKIFHIEDVSTCTKKFEQLWSDTCDIFGTRGFDMSHLNYLKTCDLLSIKCYRGTFYNFLL